MKSLLTTVTLLWLLTACQPSNQSKSLPGSGSETTAATGKPHAQYRVIYLLPNSKYERDYDTYVHAFEAKVNQAMAEGWQPVGGITTASIVAVPVQAMIKTE